MVYLHDGILLSNKKELPNDRCNRRDESEIDYFNWKKADSEDFLFYASILWPSRKSQMVVTGRTSVVAWRQEVGVGAKGTSWNDENILYVDCGGSYKIVYLCQNSSHCPLKTGDFFVCMLDSSKSDFTIVVLVSYNVSALLPRGSGIRVLEGLG